MNDLTFDFREYYRDSRDASATRLAEIFDKPVLSLGSQVEEFERRCLPYTGRVAAAAVSNCTNGLILSLSHFSKGGRVLLPSLSFGATAVSALWAGCDIVFGKYNSETLNLCLDDTCARLDKERIDAVVFVAVAGNVTGLDQIAALCASRQVPLIVDGAGAFGARLPNDGISSVVFSFASRKPLPIGEGGLVCSDDQEFIRFVKQARVYGARDGYECVNVGLNARMSEAHAAIGCAQIDAFEETSHKRYVAAKKIERLTPSVSWQAVGGDRQTTYTDLVGLVDPSGRADVVAELRLIGLDAFTFYDPPVPLHPAFRKHGRTHCDDRVMQQLHDAFIGRSVGFRPVSTFGDEHVQMVSDRINDALQRA